MSAVSCSKSTTETHREENLKETGIQLLNQVSSQCAHIVLRLHHDGGAEKKHASKNQLSQLVDWFDWWKQKSTGCSLKFTQSVAGAVGRTDRRGNDDAQILLCEKHALRERRAVCYVVAGSAGKTEGLVFYILFPVIRSRMLNDGQYPHMQSRQNTNGLPRDRLTALPVFMSRRALGGLTALPVCRSIRQLNIQNYCAR